MSVTSNYALRLQTSIFNELKKTALEEGTSLNQLINVAVAEKLAALRTQSYFETRSKRADKKNFLKILRKAGSEPPHEGDEIL